MKITESCMYREEVLYELSKVVNKKLNKLPCQLPWQGVGTVLPVA